MNKIWILPPNIANKIAAGEVVDRPAAVVKELVENAIDASADDISIIIEKAGKDLIQVIDNGLGMAGDDLSLAFQRHATSKVEKVSDLDRIMTLGFRGEALPSISSVSRVEVKSCPDGSSQGLVLRLEGGKISDREAAALKRGTIITVKNLFYNTPARRNFLRADITEFNQINKILKRFFLGYPEIHFTVKHNGKEIYNLPACTIDERLTQVFGDELYNGLVFVKEQLNEITLEGYVSRTDLTRGNSENQYIFLNKRAIHNRSLNHAVLQGYGNLIERSQYPQFVMFLNIPPQLVDVNVHPTKMEVRFSNERAIYHLFLSAVRRAVQKENIVPSFAMSGYSPAKEEIERQFRLSGSRFSAFSTSSSRINNQEAPKNQLTLSYTEPGEAKFDEDKTDRESPAHEDTGTQPKLWQVHRRYIISQIKSGLVMIDQHVAHERILFEKYLKYLNEQKQVPSQKLLFPQTLELALEDYLIFQEINDWLEKIGFVITELSNRTVLIEAIPVDVKVGYEGKVLLEIVDYYRENEGSKYQPHEKISAAFACKNAIKSGEKMTLTEMNALVDRLFATSEPYFCPHGRPVMVTLDLDEIDKKFKRI